MGLRMFPASNGDSCGAEDVVSLAVNNGDAIESGLVPPSTDAQTPLAAALQGLSPAFGDPNDGQYAILITDGDETCSSDANAPVQEAARLARLGVDTFVIGVSTQANATLLHQIAQAGRTGNARLVGNGAELGAALQAIFDELDGCECGDSILADELGELCDDGNANADDGLLGHVRGGARLGLRSARGGLQPGMR